jgi:hypothetical protein
MAELLKYKVDFNGKDTKEILNFICDTQEGKYTNEKLDLSSLQYSRIEIQESNILQTIAEENKEEVLFYGITY